MPLVTLKEVLKDAELNGTAIPAFNIDNIEIPMAIIHEAEKYHCPIIFSIGQGAIRSGKMGYLADVVKRISQNTVLPVVMHLDHGTSYGQVIQCIRAGFTSVMYDGSHYSFEENVYVTKEVVKAAHSVGVSVEAELGAIGGVEDSSCNNRINLVDVKEVERFINEVDVDALAVGIGNAHGIYKARPNLDFDRLRECKALNPPPLVMHGGSGIPDDMISEAIKIGIRKINIATELRNAFMLGLEESAKNMDLYLMYDTAMKQASRIAEAKIRLFLGLQK